MEKHWSIYCFVLCYCRFRASPDLCRDRSSITSLWPPSTYTNTPDQHISATDLPFFHCTHHKRSSTRQQDTTVSKMCLPCWPVKDIYLEDDPPHQSVHYAWDGGKWVQTARPSRSVSIRTSSFSSHSYSCLSLSSPSIAPPRECKSARHPTPPVCLGPCPGATIRQLSSIITGATDASPAHPGSERVQWTIFSLRGT